MTITAQDLYNFTKCAHRVYLDANGDPSERGEVSPFVKLLWEMGLQTERAYIERLGDLKPEDLQSFSPDDAWPATLRLMEGGADLIYQGCLKNENWVGRPDLLLKRTDGHSRFGDFYYEPLDIKAGKGWEEREGKKPSFKEHYAFQILFYRELLVRIQGYVPPVAKLINVDGEIEEFDPTHFEIAFASALEEVEQLVDGTDSSEPVLGSQCHQCEWYARCRRWVEGTQDPTGLYFVGKGKFELKKAGLMTITDIARMDVSQFLSGSKKIPRMGAQSLLRMKERAQVMLSRTPAIRPGYEFPKVRREIYFDIEDDPTRAITYLFGLVVKDRGVEPPFQYFLARHPDEEEQVARDFWKFLEETGDAVFYVYSAKERTTLKHLMKRYSLDESVFERYLGQEYDLYSDLVVKYSDWPTYSYGIKQIAKLVGFEWRDSDPSGANSIVWYNEYLQDPSREDILQRILEYNEDDCRAMIGVKEYFTSRRAASGSDGPANPMGES